MNIGIILDGNRRYAKKHGWKPWEAHHLGFKKIEELLEWSREFKVKEITLYSFSTENFNRNKTEVTILFDLFRNNVDRLMRDARIHENKIRIRIIGRLWMFPEDMQQKMKQIMEDTKDYDAFFLNIAMGYGGRQEIVDAVNTLIGSGKTNIDEHMLSQQMYLMSEPDLIIRPGGEVRTSNFLTWNSVYSEWIFIDKLWPEFTKQDFKQCLDEFKQRKRRFGK